MVAISTILTNLRDKLISVYKKFISTEYLFIFTLALILGLITGFAEVGLKYLIKVFSGLFFPGQGRSVLEQIKNSPWYFILIIPTIGLLISRTINSFFRDQSHTHGIAKIIESILINRGIIKPIIPIVKALNSAITIGMGGSVGPEGPAAYLGAGLGSTISQLFKVNTQRIRTLVAAGAGAGIAAAFNAPIAGALFAVEIILMDFKFQQFSVIVIATVMATYISRSIMGDYAEFQSHSFYISHALQFAFFIFLGLACGIVSWLFILILTRLENYFHNNEFFSSIYGTLIAGFVIGGVGIILPYILGTGYDTIDLAISNNLLWFVALAIVFVKIITTGLTLAGGGTGGVFAPAIVVGSSLGFMVGVLFNSIFPIWSPPASSMSIVGIAGLLAGTMHAPLTAIIMVFELTKNPDFILPTMITSIISVAITKKLVKESIYTISIEFKNALIKYRHQSNLLENIYVGDYFRRDFTIIYENENLSTVIENLIRDKNGYLIVYDLGNNYYGIITIETIKEIILDKHILKNLIIAGDIASQSIPKLNQNESIKQALDMMKQFSIDVLPVFLDDNVFLGVIDRRTIDEVYSEELSKMNISLSLASNVSDTNLDKYIYLSNDVILAEIEAPEFFIGKSLRELDLRNKYNLEVIMIKKTNNEQVLSNPNYVFQKNDKVVLTTNNIKNINNL